MLLAETDSRWQLFGLNVPAQPSPPRAVPAAEVEWLPTGGLRLSWTRGAHATRYRVQTRHAGQSTFTNQVTLHGLEVTLEQLTVEADLELQIIAANEVSEAHPFPVHLPLPV